MKALAYLRVSTIEQADKGYCRDPAWSVQVATTDGRPIKIVSIIDGHTRECLAAWSNARLHPTP
jgi:hypothetical protein